MREGWHGDDYLVLFDESEVAAASARYEVSRFLPGFKVLGLLSWRNHSRSLSGPIREAPRANDTWVIVWSTNGSSIGFLRVVVFAASNLLFTVRFRLPTIIRYPLM
jgi:hypothetical protein